MASTDTAFRHMLALLAVQVNSVLVSSVQIPARMASMQLSLTRDRAVINFFCHFYKWIQLHLELTAFSLFISLSLPSNFHFFCEMVKVLDIISC